MFVVIHEGFAVMIGTKGECAEYVLRYGRLNFEILPAHVEL